MTTTLAIGGRTGARIELGVVPPGKRPAPKFKAPEKDPTLPGYGSVASGTMSGYAEIREIYRDKDTGESFGYASDKSSYRYPWGLEHYTERIEYRTSERNPAETTVTGTYSMVNELKDRTIRIDQKVIFKSDLKNFRLIFERKLAVDGKLRHEKTWNEVIPRDFQ